jgi:hypothetical protein
MYRTESIHCPYMHRDLNATMVSSTRSTQAIRYTLQNVSNPAIQKLWGHNVEVFLEYKWDTQSYWEPVECRFMEEDCWARLLPS